jgi:hypothetical protein
VVWCGVCVCGGGVGVVVVVGVWVWGGIRGGCPDTGEIRGGRYAAAEGDCAQWFLVVSRGAGTGLNDEEHSNGPRSVPRRFSLFLVEL